MLKIVGNYVHVFIIFQQHSCSFWKSITCYSLPSDCLLCCLMFGTINFLTTGYGKKLKYQGRLINSLEMILFFYINPCIFGVNKHNRLLNKCCIHTFCFFTTKAYYWKTTEYSVVLDTIKKSILMQWIPLFLTYFIFFPT